MHYVTIMRPWQWIKNLIIFIPLILSEKFNSSLILVTFLFFITFSVFVSATYILNDIRDKSLDALHSEKKNRPISAGIISESNGKIFSFILLLLSSSTAYFINSKSIYYLLIYLLVTIIYTRYLKYILFLDTISIATMFTLRLLIGGLVSDVVITNYLLLFVFLSSCILSLSKKISILNSNKTHKTNEYLNLLISHNKKINFDRIYLIISCLSCTCFYFWSLDLQNKTGGQLKTIYLYIAIFLYILFCSFIFKESKIGKVEDFSLALLKNRNLTLLSFSILIMFTIGYF